jgi:hypothetical protein
MKSSAILATLFLLFAASPAAVRAQATDYNVIGIYGDPALTECWLYEVPYTVNTVYVAHVQSPGTIGARFRIEAPANWIYVDDTSTFGNVSGNPVDGITVCYPGCLTGNILLDTILYLPIQSTPACTPVQVLPHPLATSIEVATCTDSVATVIGRDLTVNIDWATCFCGLVAADASAPRQRAAVRAGTFCDPISTEPRTWGAIKSLYAH